MSGEWIRYYDGEGERARVPADEWERLVRTLADAGETAEAEAVRRAIEPGAPDPPPPASSRVRALPARPRPRATSATRAAPAPALTAEASRRFVTVVEPVWTEILPELALRLPSPSPRAYRVGLFGLDDERPARRRRDGMARVLALYLTESLRLDTTASVLCALPREADGGSANERPLFGDLEEMRAAFRVEATPDVLVGGRLRALPGASVLELEVWEVGRVRRLERFRLAAPGDRFRGAIVRAERRIWTAIADVGGLRRRDDGLHRPPRWTSGELHLACLGRLAAWVLAARGLGPADPPRPDTLAPFLELVQRSGAAPVPTWMAAAAARLALRSGGPGAPEFALEVTRRLYGAGEAPLAHRLGAGHAETAISAV